MAEVIKLHGLREIQAVFRQLPNRIADRVVMAALRAAAQVIRKDAQARAPILKTPSKSRKAGTVKANITVRRSRQNKYAVFIGVQPYSRSALREYKKSQKAAGLKVSRDDAKAFKKRLGKTISPNDPFYWWFVEFGTVRMPAQPFLRPAFEAQKYEALKRFEEYMAARVEKEAQKLAREMGLAA